MFREFVDWLLDLFSTPVTEEIKEPEQKRLSDNCFEVPKTEYARLRESDAVLKSISDIILDRTSIDLSDSKTILQIMRTERDLRMKQRRLTKNIRTSYGCSRTEDWYKGNAEGIDWCINLLTRAVASRNRRDQKNAFNDSWD